MRPFRPLTTTTCPMVVVLALAHPRNNVAGRYWPHTGHLGLTPLVLSGIVRARNDPDPASASFRPVQSSAASTSGSSASSAGSVNDRSAVRCTQITVSLRCYEARLGRVGIVRTNRLYDHSVVLWSAPVSSSNSRSKSATSSAAAATAELTQTEFPFTIVVPPSRVGGCSTCHLPSYRVYWRLEASK